jgi:hypothetical protein
MNWTTNKLWPVGTVWSRQHLCFLCPNKRTSSHAVNITAIFFSNYQCKRTGTGVCCFRTTLLRDQCTLPVSLSQLFIDLGEASTSHPISTLLPTGAATSWLDTLINGRTATWNSQVIHKIMSPCTLNSKVAASDCMIHCPQLWTQLSVAKRWGNVRGNVWEDSGK